MQKGKQILTMEGRPVDHTLTDTKKAHDPDELGREKQRLSNLLGQAMKDFMRDMAPVEGAPNAVMPDRAVLRGHHGQKWSEQAALLNKSSFPHPVDEDIMYTWIDAQLAAMDRQAEMQKSMAVADLAKYDLPPVADVPDGRLHINDRVAVTISPAGLVRVYLRTRYERDDQWLAGWTPAPSRDPVVEAVDFLLGELHNLLASMRHTGMAALTDAQVAMVKHPAHKGRGLKALLS